MALWRASGCKLALAEVNQEDEEQQESEVQLKELLQVRSGLRIYEQTGRQAGSHKAAMGAAMG